MRLHLGMQGAQLTSHGGQAAVQAVRGPARCCCTLFIHSFITRFPIRRSGAVQQTFYGSPPTCPILGIFSTMCMKALQLYTMR